MQDDENDNDIGTKLRALEQELEQTRGERDKYKTQLHSEKIGNAFAQSRFVRDKTTIPPDMLSSLFSPQFSVEDGKLVAKIYGTTVLSRHRFGEPADFDEAIELLISQHPEKARILTTPASPVTAARPTNGAGRGKTITRRQFDAMSHRDRHALLTREGYRVTD